MEKFAERLKELRNEKHLSFVALSKLVDISKSALCEYENNQAEISATNLVKLAKFFGVTTDYLLGLED